MQRIGVVIITENELKAIEYTKSILKFPKLYASTEIDGNFLRGIDKEKINTLLNLIEKQDKLIDLIVQDVSSDVCNSKKCSQYENCKECKLDKYRKRVEENE